MKSSMHNHTTFCDGKNSPKEMAEAAYKLGFTDFGFSGHSSYLDRFKGWGIDDEEKYIAEINSLKEEYKGKMNIYTGLEQDYYGITKYRNRYEYIIGSVHGFMDEKKENYYSVDDKIEDLIKGADKMYKGSIMKAVERYYNLVVKNAYEQNPDIVGHIDLIVKNNKNMVLFNEKSVEYQRISKEALEKLLSRQSVIELNTGAISRGYRDMPYPSEELLYIINRRNGNITINGDSHAINTIDFWFKEAIDLLKDIGFKEILVFKNGKFEKTKI